MPPIKPPKDDEFDQALDPQAEALRMAEERIRQLEAENSALAATGSEMVTPEKIEAQIREEYHAGATNYQQLALKYRYTVDEIRRIIGDRDLIQPGTGDGMHEEALEAYRATSAH